MFSCVVKAGDMVFSQGDVGHCFFIVEKGHLEVLVNDKPKKELKPQDGRMSNLLQVSENWLSSTIHSELHRSGPPKPAICGSSTDKHSVRPLKRSLRGSTKKTGSVWTESASFSTSPTSRRISSLRRSSTRSTTRTKPSFRKVIRVRPSTSSRMGLLQSTKATSSPVSSTREIPSVSSPSTTILSGSSRSKPKTKSLAWCLEETPSAGCLAIRFTK